MAAFSTQSKKVWPAHHRTSPEVYTRYIPTLIGDQSEALTEQIYQAALRQIRHERRFQLEPGTPQSALSNVVAPE